MGTYGAIGTAHIGTTIFTNLEFLGERFYMLFQKALRRIYVCTYYVYSNSVQVVFFLCISIDKMTVLEAGAGGGGYVCLIIFHFPDFFKIDIFLVLFLISELQHECLLSRLCKFKIDVCHNFGK